MSEHHKEATAYFQVVMGVGYIGLFSAWSFTSDEISTLERGISGSLGVLSLSVFVLHSVLTTMPQREQNTKQQHKEPLTLECDLADKVQPTFWWVSTITGFGSAIIVFYVFLRMMFPCLPSIN
jgi:hypothetical protein